MERSLVIAGLASKAFVIAAGGMVRFSMIGSVQCPPTISCVSELTVRSVNVIHVII